MYLVGFTILIYCDVQSENIKFLTVLPINVFLNTLNILKPTGHVTHQQFNIQQLYALPTLYLCVLCLCENKQRLVPLTA
jgi:hypothetical protein